MRRWSTDPDCVSKGLARDSWAGKVLESTRKGRTGVCKARFVVLTLGESFLLESRCCQRCWSTSGWLRKIEIAQGGFLLVKKSQICQTAMGRRDSWAHY